ncbi:choice-of-anchor C family PEP-CTERM protein [Sphingobium lignivorans]|uniref:Choice-of-anchor C domain-containing protein n=1 Tax=Sphingobium lignivorans TaxID=2735886 RepID=A0ABR6NKB6_9SPHN|nr:choice-of-anchor C family protein [Sphingobium lignivorans]MBB5987561.1 choice-of-anchor C domain-containing protein [Sphingobium lignivorans]
MNRLMIAMLGATMLAGAAQAAPFTNGSFEDIDAPVNSYRNYSAGSNLGGWTVFTGAVDLIHGGYLNPDFVASDGINSIDMNGSTGQVGGISQSFDTLAGGTYTVTFDMNANVYDGFIGMKNLLVEVAGFSQEFGYDTSLHPIGQGGPWTTHSFDFVALSSSSTLSFLSTYTGGGRVYGALLDNVRVTHLDGSVPGAVPEPASWAMMIGGFALAGSTLRRRRTAVAFA